MTTTNLKTDRDIVDMIVQYGLLRYRAGCSGLESSVKLLHEADAKLSEITAITGQFQQDQASAVRMLPNDGKHSAQTPEPAAEYEQRYRKLRRWMGSNVPEGWSQVEDLGAVCAWMGAGEFDKYLDSLPECQIGLSAGAQPRTAIAAQLPDRDISKPDEQQGMFRKFDVRRVDGSDAPGGKHHGCRNFVLDLDHDAHAAIAMAAYLRSCASTHRQLAADIAAQLGLVSAMGMGDD